MITEYDSQVARQRKAFGIVFAFTVVALVALSFVYADRHRTHVALLARGDAVKRDIQAISTCFRSRSMVGLLAEEDARSEHLAREWEKLRSKVDTFRGSSPLVEALSPDAKGHIDFKIALYEARDRLQALADEQSVGLPENLGMQEATEEGEEVEARIWQLASLVRLVESCIAHDVQNVESLEVLPPTIYPLLEEEQSVAIEYPVRITLNCQFDAFMRLLVHLDRPGSFLSIRECKIALLGTAQDIPLRATLVAGAINFRLRGEHDAVIQGGKEPSRE